MVNVAILGYGTVGSGVFKIIEQNNRHVSRRAGDVVKVKYVLDLRDFPGDPVESVLVHDIDTIIDDEEINLYMVNPKSPCFIRDEEGRYCYLILPVNFINVD